MSFRAGALRSPIADTRRPRLWVFHPRAAVERAREFGLEATITEIVVEHVGHVDYGGAVVGEQVPDPSTGVGAGERVAVSVEPQISGLPSCPPALVGSDGEPIPERPLFHVRMPDVEGMAVNVALAAINRLVRDDQRTERPSWLRLYRALDRRTPVASQTPAAGTRFGVYSSCARRAATRIALTLGLRPS